MNEEYVDFGPNNCYTLCRDGSLYSNTLKKFLSMSPHPVYCDNRLKHGIFYRHRLVALHFVFNPRPGYFIIVDHVNTNTRNNYYLNLRWVTDELNKLNRMSKKISPTRHSASNKPYKAQLQFRNHKRHLGYYASECEALFVQDRVRDELFKKFYRYETQPTTFGPPDLWKITTNGVETN